MYLSLEGWGGFPSRKTLHFYVAVISFKDYKLFLNPNVIYKYSLKIPVCDIVMRPWTKSPLLWCILIGMESFKIDHKFICTDLKFIPGDLNITQFMFRCHQTCNCFHISHYAVLSDCTINLLWLWQLFRNVANTDLC